MIIADPIMLFMNTLIHPAIHAYLPAVFAHNHSRLWWNYEASCCCDVQASDHVYVSPVLSPDMPFLDGN